MPFSGTTTRTYEETRSRPSTDYVKFDEHHRTVLRMLNGEARRAWKHFIQEGNGGKGLSAVCPNISADIKVCPIEASVADLPKDDPKRKAQNARLRMVVNVLDRTPYTTCKKCGNESAGKTCQTCFNDLSKHDFAPLNKVKIMESGPMLFRDNLDAIEQSQKEELKLDITDYDLTFTTTGKGRDKKTVAIPQPAKPLDESWLLDEEGNPQKLYDLDLLTEPTPVSEVLLMLEGKTVKEINEARGI